MRIWITCFKVGNFETCNSMQRNHCEDRCISKLFGKVHNFCIDWVERSKDCDKDILPLDLEHLMNGEVEYVPMANVMDSNHDVPIPRDIIDGSNHFDNQPRAAHQHEFCNLTPRRK